MTAPRLRDHGLSDLRPVGVCDDTLRAEAFLAMFSRLNGAMDLESEFLRWCESKDFSPRDRLSIAREVRRLLARRDRR